MGAEPITKGIVAGWSGEFSQVQEACASGHLAIKPLTCLVTAISNPDMARPRNVRNLVGKW